ncbi:succinate dehydrogenase cytochrome b subunit [Nocardioides hwasunensis]|uniref:Succinate dehydrogenase cytochrome b subunit n=2 Tax=Nocardioides hwasunensis TaxID=397258 RepID=A0ABR8MDG9_9ACTN|nr:succinate dehydrogenase cytochrome b subunit [Nocardioides hwasunensis]
MAVSGFIFIGFVLAHMYGNLKAFAGHDAFNDYAHHLRQIGEPMLPHEGVLWILRVGLIVSLVVHVYCAVVLWRRASHARGTKYVTKKNTGASRSSLTMRWGGLTILVFLVWHLLNFTIGKINPQGGATNDPYNLLVDTFDVWWLTLIYLVAMVALGLHLNHGVWSAAQTLGWTGNAAKRVRAKRLALALALIVSVGFSLVPLGVLAGIITK